MFGFHTAELSDQTIDTLVKHLLRVKPTNNLTIEFIDYGIEHLLKSNKEEKAFKFLQDLLIAHADELSMKSFDNVARHIHGDKALMSKVATRWLLQGKRVLCEGVRTIVAVAHDADSPLDIDPAELQSSDAVHFEFVARKAIGYLFSNPRSAASLIVSLMKYAPDEETLSKLGSLLFDPLLLNFTGKARDYVAQRASAESGSVKDTLNRALEAVDDYLEVLRSAGEVPALHPSEHQRGAHHRHVSRQIAEAFKEAESKSVLLSLVSKQVLLYGRGSINYVYGPDGQVERMETPLHEYSGEIEVPRLQHLDPFGLDYMLRVFRTEQFRT